MTNIISYETTGLFLVTTPCNGFLSALQVLSPLVTFRMSKFTTFTIYSVLEQLKWACRFTLKCWNSKLLQSRLMLEGKENNITKLFYSTSPASTLKLHNWISLDLFSLWQKNGSVTTTIDVHINLNNSIEVGIFTKPQFYKRGKSSSLIFAQSGISRGIGFRNNIVKPSFVIVRCFRLPSLI